MDATTEDQNNIDHATDSYPLLVETQEHHENEHVIDLQNDDDDDDTSSSNGNSLHGLAHGPRESTSQLVPASSSGSSSLGRRRDGSGRRRWSPFDTLLWISIEFGFTLGQIIASVFVLYISRNENPQTPLFAWIVGYAAGCVASLPFLYWRYLRRNLGTENGSNHTRQPTTENGLNHSTHQPEPNSYITISFARSSEEENLPATSAGTWNWLNVGSNARFAMATSEYGLMIGMMMTIFMATFVAADPDLLQDVCVADLKSDVKVNGFVCKSNISANDFFFNGLAKPGLTNNTLGATVTAASVLQFPGLNTLGVSMARIDYAPGGLNPPHTHPRATEIVFVLTGELSVGFITTDNKLFSKTIKEGEVFIFPRGLLHFQINNGKVPAAVIAGFNSQLPGTQRAADALFASSPTIDPVVLSKAFQIDIKEVEDIKSKLAPKK